MPGFLHCKRALFEMLSTDIHSFGMQYFLAQIENRIGEDGIKLLTKSKEKDILILVTIIVFEKRYL